MIELSLATLLSIVPAPELNFYERLNEKPLVTVSFKCPTEHIGISTPSTVCLRNSIDNVFTILNKSNLLSVEIVQVCN